MLVHPDKNPDNKEKAETAFEIVRKAWQVLENEETRTKCMAIIEEAKERTNLMISDKRKKLKKDERVEEDDPEIYKRSIYVMTMKLFAEAERRKRSLEQRSMEEKKRQREQEIEKEEEYALQKEWQKNFDVSCPLRFISFFLNLYFITERNIGKCCSKFCKSLKCNVLYV